VAELQTKMTEKLKKACIIWKNFVSLHWILNKKENDKIY
jgi:hypothetical protein